jgi:hypothetical protein
MLRWICDHIRSVQFRNDEAGFSGRLASDEITTRGYKVLKFAKCITIMIAVLAVTSSLRSYFD